MFPIHAPCTVETKHQWGDVAHMHTHGGGYEKINTHRQDGWIVQSHHRILCNNPKCRRSALLYLSSSHTASLSLRACVTSPARSLLSVSQIQNLPLSAPAHSVCHANRSLPPPSPRLHHLLLLRWLSLLLSLVCLLSFLWSPTHFFSLSFSHSLPSFQLPLAFCFAAIPLPAHLLCLLSHPDSLTPPPPASVTPAIFPLPFCFFLALCSLSPCRWVNWACWYHREGISLSLFSLSETRTVLHKCAFFKNTPSSLLSESHNSTQSVFPLYFQKAEIFINKSNDASPTPHFIFV